MPEFNAFLRQAAAIRLDKSERADVRRTLMVACHEHKRAALLSDLERDGLRDGLLEFMRQNPLRSRLVPVPAEEQYVSPWLGANLFGCLRPFSV